MSGTSKARPVLTRLVLNFVIASAVAGGVLAFIIPSRPIPINVRWAAGVTEAERGEAERRLRLADGHVMEGRTWAYQLPDGSTASIRAIVMDASVEDTANLNRVRFRPYAQFDRTRRLVVDALACGAAISILWLFVPVARRAGTRPASLTERTTVLLAGAAPLRFAACSGMLLAAAALGYEPLWQPPPPVTLTHAAYVADLVTASRMIEQGTDPNAVGVVAINAHKVRLTPLEAGVESGDLDIVTLLVKMGARVDESNRLRLACLAEAVGASDIASYLRGAGNAVDCRGATLPPR